METARYHATQLWRLRGHIGRRQQFRHVPGITVTRAVDCTRGETRWRNDTPRWWWCWQGHFKPHHTASPVRANKTPPSTLRDYTPGCPAQDDDITARSRRDVACCGGQLSSSIQPNLCINETNNPHTYMHIHTYLHGLGPTPSTPKRSQTWLMDSFCDLTNNKHGSWGFTVKVHIVKIKVPTSLIVCWGTCCWAMHHKATHHDGRWQDW